MHDLTVGSVFSGAGLLDYGLHLAGLHHRWFCESVEFRRGILARRWPGVPVHDDIRTLHDPGAVDVVAGGFPCKGISSAGKREGFGHPETVLWREMRRVVRDVRPRYVLVENVADILVLRGGSLFNEVLGDLAALGYDTEWDCFPAAAFGAPHRRDRVFITAVADPDSLAWREALGRDRRPGAVAEPGAVERAERLHGMGAAADSTDGTEPHRTSSTARGATQRPVGGTEPGTGGRVGRGDPAAGIQGRDRDQRPFGATAPDAGRERRQQVSRGTHGDETKASGRRTDTDHEPTSASEERVPAAEWVDYAVVIDRWGRILGRAAPEPLVRGVDDGSARRVDRSRLAALGDGVLVQAGWFCGQRIVEHASMTALPGAGTDSEAA